MGVYRANAADAAQFVRVLDRENVPYEIEKFGSAVTYISVTSSRSDIPDLARSAVGRCGRS